MKYGGRPGGGLAYLSPPVRGAWVEIVRNDMTGDWKISSPPVRGAWVEII